MELSRKRQRRVMSGAQSGIKPSDASSTISNGVRPFGVSCPRVSVSQMMPGAMRWTCDFDGRVDFSAFRNSNGSVCFDFDSALGRFVVLAARLADGIVSL